MPEVGGDRSFGMSEERLWGVGSQRTDDGETMITDVTEYLNQKLVSTTRCTKEPSVKTTHS